jgi:hypothetical protein
VTVARAANGRFLSRKVREAIDCDRSPELTPEQIAEAQAPMPARSAESSTAGSAYAVDGSASRAIPLRRAVAGEHVHRHYRDDGRGYVSHQHRVRSERHSHPTLGLALVSLRWIGFSWTRVGGAVIYVGTVAVYVGLALAALIGWLYFARTIR